MLLRRAQLIYEASLYRKTRKISRVSLWALQEYMGKRHRREIDPLLKAARVRLRPTGTGRYEPLTRDEVKRVLSIWYQRSGDRFLRLIEHAAEIEARDP